MTDIAINIPPERRGLKLFFGMKRDPLNFFTRLMNESGDYAWMDVNGRKLVMLNDATGIEHVLQNNAANYFKGHFQRSMKPVFGESMLLQEGTIWRKRRENAAPVFANRNFEEITHQMTGAAEAMFKRWDQMIERGELIDITMEMTRFTLDALLRSLFHEARDEVAAEMRSALGIMLRDVEKRLWSAIQLPKFIAYNLPKYKAAKYFMKKVVAELINVRRTEKTYPEDLLSRLINDFGSSAKEQKHLFDEVQSYVLAGHETTAHGLAWALYNLSRYPLVQRGVQEEVARVLGSKAPNMESIKHLSYTRQVFDEVLRLFPPVWTMSREAIFEDRIPLDNGQTLEIKPHDSVMMCHYAVHRREKYWPSPEAFDPDRFNPENTKARPKFAFFPFGGGPRLCLGFRFAQVESIIALAMITQRYKFSLVSGQQVEPDPIITLRPRDSILFRMQKRDDFQPVPPATAVLVTPLTQIANVDAATTHVSKCPFH